MQTTIMRRHRRHRWLTYSVLIIAYTIFQAVLSTDEESLALDEDLTEPPLSKSSNGDEGRSTPEDAEIDVTKSGEEGEKGKSDHKEKGQANGKDDSNQKEKEGTDDKGKSDIKGKEEVDEQENLDEKGKEDADEKEKSNQKGKEEADESEKKIQKDAEFNETKTTNQKEYRPKRKMECVPPAIEQFPRPLMGPYARRHGGLIIHFLVAIFTFIGLAIVCDEYFVSSLDRICEEMKLAPDVAGATFMAAGSSAPELATVVIGVFCAKDDIGVSGVIGSAVFNIMFVISVCALCAGTVSHLNWWPLCRDCFFYAISILVMLFTIYDGYVTWPEALFMLIMYVVYCVALRFNNELEQWVMTIPLPFKLPTREEQAALVTYRSAKGTASGLAAPPASGDNQYTQMEGATNETPLQGTNPSTDGTYDNAGYNAENASSWNSGQVWDPNVVWSDDQTGGNTWDSNASWNTNGQQPPQQEPKPPQHQQQQAQPAPVPQQALPTYYKAKEYNPETAVDPLVKPTNANQLQLAFWYVAYPIHWACRHTMPDCHGRWYPITFLVSMLWISFYSYFMVWMITIIGTTLSIPDTVMGLTFVAAGVSVPDALSSLAVIKEGYGDMAVSNAIGSNVFDILVCLGLPWFIQTALILPGSYVNVFSKGLTYSTLSLLSTVVFLVVATHYNGWKLDRKYGVVLMIWYLLFITFASLYEMDVFGITNLRDCGSDY